MPELEPAPELDPELEPEPDPDDAAPELEPAPDPEPAPIPEEDVEPERDPEDPEPELDPASAPCADPELRCDAQATATSTINGKGNQRRSIVLPMYELFKPYATGHRIEIMNYCWIKAATSMLL